MPTKSSIGTTPLSITGGTSTPIPYGLDVVIRAHPDNSGNVAAGTSASVTVNSADATDGMLLDANEGYIMKRDRVPGADAANIYVVGSASGQKVIYDIG